ncbi:MAG: hypothetical protein AB7T38_01835 [Nitrospirales bacterium]
MCPGLVVLPVPHEPRFNSLTVAYSEPLTLLATVKQVQKGLPSSAWLVVVNVPDVLLSAVETRPWAWTLDVLRFSIPWQG